jgi:hypothetical protein
VDIQFKGARYTVSGLNLANTCYSTGLYKGVHGVTINDIFTYHDEVRAWRGRKLTSPADM